jgi:pentatricopeptide repeat protein
MSELGISFNAQTYSIVISRYVALRNLEMALQFLFEMSTRGLPPDHKTLQGVISLAAEVNSPRLALDLVASFEESSGRKLDPEVWVDCLIASARDLYVSLHRFPSSCAH